MFCVFKVNINSERTKVFCYFYLIWVIVLYFSDCCEFLVLSRFIKKLFARIVDYPIALLDSFQRIQFAMTGLCKLTIYSTLYMVS